MVAASFTSLGPGEWYNGLYQCTSHWTVHFLYWEIRTRCKMLSWTLISQNLILLYSAFHLPSKGRRGYANPPCPCFCLHGLLTRGTQFGFKKLRIS